MASACGGMALLASVQVSADPLTGPVYPPPGGVTFSSNGVQAISNGRVATYSNFDLGASSALYFGISPVGLAMDGAIDSPGETLTFNSSLSNLASGIAVYSGMTTVNNLGVNQSVFTLFTLVYTDLSGNSLAIATNPDVGGGAFPVLDVQGSYKVGEAFTASSTQNGTYIDAADYFNNLHTPNVPNLLQSSFSGGFYYDAAVPEPATWALMLIGFAGIGMVMRRSRKDSSFLQIA